MHVFVVNLSADMTGSHQISKDEIEVRNLHPAFHSSVVGLEDLSCCNASQRLGIIHFEGAVKFACNKQ